MCGPFTCDNISTRNNGIDFIIKTTTKTNLSFESMHVAIELFDIINVHNELKLACATCLMIASKLHDEPRALYPVDCKYFTDASISNILENEIFVLQYIDYRCFVPTVYHIAHMMGLQYNIPLNKFLITWCLNYFVKVTCHSRTIKAAAIAYIVAHAQDLSLKWPDNLKNTCNIDEEAIINYSQTMVQQCGFYNIHGFVNKKINKRNKRLLNDETKSVS